VSDSSADRHPEDRAVLDAFDDGSRWLRALLCTLARRGVAFRLAHPERARDLLDALAVAPLYKAGQFLFDLMEWEDFMVDGTPPPILPTALDAGALARMAASLRALGTHLDGAVGASSAFADVEVVGGASVEPLPPLDAGLHLYADVVLGIVRSATPFVVAATRRSEP
jgi:hypothetical protein